MLEIFIVLNEKGKQKDQGERETNATEKEGEGEKQHPFFGFFS